MPNITYTEVDFAALQTLHVWVIHGDNVVREQEYVRVGESLNVEWVADKMTRRTRVSSGSTQRRSTSSVPYTQQTVLNARPATLWSLQRAGTRI